MRTFIFLVLDLKWILYWYYQWYYYKQDRKVLVFEIFCFLLAFGRNTFGVFLYQLTKGSSFILLTWGVGVALSWEPASYTFSHDLIMYAFSLGVIFEEDIVEVQCYNYVSFKRKLRRESVINAILIRKGLFKIATSFQEYKSNESMCFLHWKCFLFSKRKTGNGSSISVFRFYFSKRKTKNGKNFSFHP